VDHLRLESLQDDQLLRFTKQELIVPNNALNEVLHALPIPNSRPASAAHAKTLPSFFEGSLSFSIH